MTGELALSATLKLLMQPHRVILWTQHGQLPHMISKTCSSFHGMVSEVHISTRITNTMILEIQSGGMIIQELLVPLEAILLTQIAQARIVKDFLTLTHSQWSKVTSLMAKESALQEISKLTSRIRSNHHLHQATVQKGISSVAQLTLMSSIRHASKERAN